MQRRCRLAGPRLSASTCGELDQNLFGAILELELHREANEVTDLIVCEERHALGLEAGGFAHAVNSLIARRRLGVTADRGAAEEACLVCGQDIGFFFSG